jgi:hypothetical protein
LLFHLQKKSPRKRFEGFKAAPFNLNARLMEIVPSQARRQRATFCPPTEVGGYKNEACYLDCALRVENLGLGLFL